MLCVNCEDRKKLAKIQFVIWMYISVKGTANHRCALLSNIRGS
jgi:hypothetical protein